MEQTDEQLIEEFFAGNPKCMEIIFHRHKIRVFNYALRVLANRADAEDTTSDIFLKLSSKQFTFQPQAKFTTWLYRIVHNACIDRLRRQKKIFSWKIKTEDGEEKEWDLADEKDLPREELDQKEKGILIRKSIDRLPLQQKEAILLREYQNLSYQEISEILDCSLESVKILIFRARESLKKELAPLFREGSL